MRYFSWDILHLIISWDRKLASTAVIATFQCFDFQAQMEWAVEKWGIKSKANFLKLSKQLDVRIRLGWIKSTHGPAELMSHGATLTWHHPVVPCLAQIPRGKAPPHCAALNLSAVLCKDLALPFLGQLALILFQEPIIDNGLVCRRRYLAFECRHGDGMGSLAWLLILSSALAAQMASYQAKGRN